MQEGNKPLLVGIELHFSLGGAEIKEWKYNKETIEGILHTYCLYAVKFTAAFTLI